MGEFVLVLDGVVDLKCVEAIACREAMCFGVLHVGDDVIASDWMDVVKEIAEGSKGEHAMIINETRRMKVEVGYIVFHHEYRDSNEDTHTIVEIL